MKKSVTTMVNEALALITTHSVETARTLHGQPGVQFVDLRDPRELEREGAIPGAFHAPRGMLEFWVDTESPYHKPVFNQPGTQYVLFCAGGWRSALAARTMLEMASRTSPTSTAASAPGRRPAIRWSRKRNGRPGLPRGRPLRDRKNPPPPISRRTCQPRPSAAHRTAWPWRCRPAPSRRPRHPTAWPSSGRRTRPRS